METTLIETNGIRLHVARAGPADGPLLIFLHGFPEFWYGWRKQIPHFADAGFRVLVPDQRGYNLSDKPEGALAFSLDELAADVLGLMDAAGRERACLVGHDWGAAVAWWIAEHHPGRVERMAILNVPHGSVFLRQLRRSPRQWLRSWYIAFFQLPRLPEAVFRRRDWRAAAKALRLSARPGAFTAEDLERYRDAWSQPGAITAMINWYRALLRHRPHYPARPRISVPTLMIWGAGDAYLEKEMAKASIALCEKGRLILVEEATHWVQHEEPERVNRWIEAFLRPGEHPV